MTADQNAVAAVAKPARDDVLESSLRELMPDILNYFRRRLREHDEAADALSETLLVLWRKRGVLAPDDEEAVRRYAFGVARKVLASARRRSLRRQSIADRLRAELIAQTPRQAADPDLETSLNKLRPRDRELILLVAWDGFSVTEAAKILRISPGAARTRYSRARARLRELLDGAGASGH